MKKKAVGASFEEEAEELLRRRGYKIRERNFRCPFGEVDIIAEKGEYIVFVEVKGRRSAEYGMAQEAIDKRKQKKLFLCAFYYMKRKGLFEKQARFDAICINEGKIEFIEDALEANL